MNIDKWFAEKCGITFKDGQFTDDYYWCVNNSIQGSDWSIYKPDCREIIREKFQLSTLRTPSKGGVWGCGDEKSRLVGRGETIHEAELACLQAIYNNRAA